MRRETMQARVRRGNSLFYHFEAPFTKFFDRLTRLRKPINCRAPEERPRTHLSITATVANVTQSTRILTKKIHCKRGEKSYPTGFQLPTAVSAPRELTNRNCHKPHSSMNYTATIFFKTAQQQIKNTNAN